MKTCKQCKDEACSDVGSGGAACEDFTSEAIEEALPDWRPTLADFEKLEGLYLDCLDEVTRLEARIRGFESAISSVVRWAQGDEAP